jgi:peroxiredoxin family protein
MKKTMKKNGVAPLNELRSMCQEFDVKHQSINKFICTYNPFVL